MRTRWTDELLEAALRPICQELGHFPSVTELKARGRNDVACRVANRSGGMIAWAKRMGFERVHSDSDTGWEGERTVAAILRNRGFHVKERESQKCPYDLLVSEVIRIDVKTASYAEYDNTRKGGKCTGWFYRIGKDTSCDIVILYQQDTGICYIIPWKYCTSSNITITKTGDTYAKFRENFKLLESLVRSRSTEFETIP